MGVGGRKYVDFHRIGRLIREFLPPIRKNDRAGRHRRSEFRKCLPAPALGEVLLGCGCQGMPPLPSPVQAKTLVGTASKLRLDGHGFAPDAAEKNPRIFAPGHCFVRFLPVLVLLRQWAGCPQNRSDRPGSLVPVPLIFASRSSASTGHHELALIHHRAS
jgi:hypothetical protein